MCECQRCAICGQPDDDWHKSLPHMFEPLPNVMALVPVNAAGDSMTLPELLEALRATPIRDGSFSVLGYVGDDGNCYALTEADLRGR